MTLVQLSYIVAVDNYKNFAEAAKKCFVTQPTLSMQIQKLEAELGVIIFDRSKQPVTATDIGKKILEQARTLLHESARVNEIIQDESEEIKGTFKLGVIPTIAPYLLPLFIKSFVTKYNQLELVIDEIQTPEIIEKLLADDLDAAIAATPLHNQQLVEKPLYYEPFVGYVSKSHRLNRRKKITADDLSLNDIFLLKEGHCFRDQSIQICKKIERENIDGTGKFNFEGGSLETLKKIVDSDFGMTLLPYLSLSEIDDENKFLHVREFEQPLPKREISLISHRAQLKKRILLLLEEEIVNAVPAELRKKGRDFIVGL